MDQDLELLGQLLGPLDSAAPEVRSRVLGLLAAKYGVAGVQTPIAPSSPRSQPDGTNEASSFADLFHTANPNGARERALVGAYWVSIVEGQTTFASQAINALLKDLGYQVGNITDAITQCMREKPAWIIQTRKSGSTKQSRKEYKLTEAGRRRVIAMLSVATEK